MKHKHVLFAFRPRYTLLHYYYMHFDFHARIVTSFESRDYAHNRSVFNTVTFTEYIMSKFQQSKIADKIMELGKKEASKTSFSDVSNIILDVPEIMIYDHDLIAIISGFTPQDCYDLVKMLPVLGID